MSYIKPIQTFHRHSLKRSSFYGTNIYLTPQSNGFKSSCVTANGFLVVSARMTRHCIQVLSSEQEREVGLTVVTAQLFIVLLVSTQRLLQDLHQILLRELHQRITSSNVTTCSQAIVYQRIIIFHQLLDDSHTLMVVNAMDTLVGAYLLTMPVAKYSIFLSIPTQQPSRYVVQCVWKHWLVMKDSW